MTEHPKSRLAWVSVAKDGRVYCEHCGQPSPCDERVARHRQDHLHRFQCVPLGQCFLAAERDEAQGRTAKTTIVIHRKLDDGGHWFCCGEGERFSYDAADLVDAPTLEALLPLVETYARASIARALRAWADDLDGITGARWIAEGARNRAGQIEAAR